MARKTKDLEETTKTTKKTTTKKNSTDKVKKDEKKATTKKKTTTKRASTVAKKSTATKKVENSSNVVPKEKKSTVKKKSTKKAATKKATTKTTKSKKSVKEVKKEFKPEYYDLPYSYNKTTVKILAQTPKVLFVYWEISEKDRKDFIKLYGENFFERTKPVLIVYNHTMNYSFEIDINDFANSWYIHINDSDCHYTVELGRKPLQFANSIKFSESDSTYIPYYVYVTSSNQMDSPNNHILYNFDKQIAYRNIKTGEIINRNINDFRFITNFGIMNINELYRLLYPGENFEDDLLHNPSSSSQFK